MSSVTRSACTSDLIPLGQKVAYAAGMLVNNLQAAAMPAMMVVLNLGIGLDPRLVGIIGFIPRIFDAVSDPLVDYVSDIRVRDGVADDHIFSWGYYGWSCLCRDVAVPGWTDKDILFLVFSDWFNSLFFDYTVYATPFVAFGYEMTPDYHERTRLHAFANTAGQLAWIGAPWIWWVMSSFENKVHGASVLGLWFGGAIAILGVVPALFCRERLSDIPQETQLEERQSIFSNLNSFFQGLVTAMRCKPFSKLCAATFLVFNGYQLGISFALYVMIYYLFNGDNQAAGQLNGQWGSLTAICTVGVIPLTALISEKIGKRRTFWSQFHFLF